MELNLHWKCATGEWKRIDSFHRKVAGWLMRPDIDRTLVIDAPDTALFQRVRRRYRRFFTSIVAVRRLCSISTAC
jgi:hypothetical protein